MCSQKRSFVLTVIFVGLIVIIDALKADYYEPDFFPIGLTGLNSTGYNPPYGDVGPRWEWDGLSEYTEQSLIFSLGVNCIGSEDAKPDYLMDMRPTSPYENNYLHKVCIPSLQRGEDSTIYLITAGLWIDSIRCHGNAGWADSTKLGLSNTDTCKCKDCGGDSVYDYATYPWEGRCGLLDSADSELPLKFYNCKDKGGNLKSPDTMLPSGSAVHKRYSRASGGNIPSSSLFRSWTGASGIIAYGPDEFDSCPSTWDKDAAWDTMMNRAIDSLRKHFENNSDHDDCIWGWNILTEGPAIYRNSNVSPMPGVWAAVNRVLVGPTGNGGIRDIENDYMGGVHRMIVAKGGTWPLHKGGYDIFQEVPQLDALVSYAEQLCPSCWNYGDEQVFDRLLYDVDPSRKGGWHNTAIYFQQHAKNNLAYPDQKKRWIVGIGTAWYHMNPEATRAIYRRPCPPEFRCATYLALSRGAKGVLFIRWVAWVGAGGITEYPMVTIPCDTSGLEKDYSNVSEVGIRDHLGWPFGIGPSGDPDYVADNHLLNVGYDVLGNKTYWHDHPRDSTYLYFKNSLIPEIKAIAPTLIQLDWVNGYSLNSTDSDWASPCPHVYVKSVTGAEYVDLAFFDHPYEPVGVEYFMLVNREGIADMTNRTVSVALDAGHWPQADSLILTDIARADSPRKLAREGNRYTFNEVFEPGEGKLYRVTPVSEAPIASANH